MCSSKLHAEQQMLGIPQSARTDVLVVAGDHHAGLAYETTTTTTQLLHHENYATT